MTKYELWHSEQEVSYTFCAAGRAHQAVLPADARCIWTVEADSWEEAATQRNIYLGWEPYKPMIDPEVDRENAYTLILRRPPSEIRGPCALYAYTALLTPRFKRVHTADSIGALLDWMRAWLRPEILAEIQNDEDFWYNMDADVQAIQDGDLKAFVRYTLNTPVAPVYAYKQCVYLEGLLDDLPNQRFVMGWEARAPRQDVAYGIVEHVR